MIEQPAQIVYGYFLETAFRSCNTALVSFSDIQFLPWNWFWVVTYYLKLIFLRRLWCVCDVLYSAPLLWRTSILYSQVSPWHTEKRKEANPLPPLPAFILFTVDMFPLCPRKRFFEWWLLSRCRKRRWETSFIGMSLREDHWLTPRILNSIWLLQESHELDWSQPVSSPTGELWNASVGKSTSQANVGTSVWILAFT